MASEPEVAAGGGLQGLDRADVALDEDVDAAVPGLGGDQLDADSGEGEGGASGVAGAQGVSADSVAEQAGCPGMVTGWPCRAPTQSS